MFNLGVFGSDIYVGTRLPLIFSNMGKCRMPLDMYDLKPDGMVSYLRYNGYHFSKKMCEWAVSLMYKYDPSSKHDVSISFWDKEKVDALLLGQGVEVKNKIGYYNPQNEMFNNRKTKRICFQNETYIFRFSLHYANNVIIIAF